MAIRRRAKLKYRNSTEMVQRIKQNYIDLEMAFSKQLGIETPIHHLSTGNYREEIWLSLFKQVIPKKFHIAKGVFIIDSYGAISPEVDIAIYDEQYTPYIFQAGNQMKFIPIEAVAVVIQCKSENVNKENVDKWEKKIENLKTRVNAVVRLQASLLKTQPGSTRLKIPSTQTSTRPVRILCKLNDSQQYVGENFDIVLSTNQKKANLSGEPFKMSKKINGEKEDLIYWNKKLNHFSHNRYEGDMPLKLDQLAHFDETSELKPLGVSLDDLNVSDKDGNENVILSLTFQLNQLLMLLNNPLFFPHQSYANLFDEFRSKGESNDEQ